MALARDIIPVPLAQGPDTRSDPKQLAPGKLLALQNGTFSSPGQIQKRNGYSALSTSVLGGGSISTGALLTNLGNETVALDGQSLYSYSPDVSAWVNKGALINCAGSVSAVSRGYSSQTSPDAAYDSATGLKCFAFMSGSTPSYSVVDTATGVEIVNNAAITGGPYFNVKVLALGTNFIFILGNATTISYASISTSAPQTVSGVTVISASASSASFDATLINGSAALAWTSGGGGSISVVSVSSALSVGTIFVYTIVATATGPVSIVGDASNRAWVAYIGSGNVYAMVLAAGLASQTLAVGLRQTSPSIGLSSASTVVNLTATVSGNTATYIIEVQPQASYLISFAVTGLGNLIYSFTLTVAGSSSVAALLFTNLGLASKAFAYNGSVYYLAVYAGTYIANAAGQYNLVTAEPTLFLIGAGAVVAKYAKENAGQYFTTGQLPEAPTTGTGNYFFGIQETVSVTAVSGVPVYTYGISQATVNFLPGVEPPNVQLGQALLVSSGFVAMYDGKSVCEQNFHTYPENLSAVANGLQGGIGAGTSSSSVLNIQYVAAWEWTDGQGQVHRSAPSVPMTYSLPVGSTAGFTGTTTSGSNVITSVTRSGGVPLLFVGQTIKSASSLFPAGTTITAWNSSTNTLTISNPATGSATGTSLSTPDIYAITVTLPALPATSKPSGSVSAVVYRTQVNGTVFYKVGAVAASLSSSVTFTDTAPDSIIIGNPQLYTTGEVENSAPPQLSALATFKSRAVGIPTENPYGLIYSKQVVPAPAGVASSGSPVEFSSFFAQNCDSLGGPLTALGAMDDKLILFKQNVIFYMVGSGPAASGVGNDFTDPQLVNANVGCTNPASVVSTPYGVMFQAQSGGIWLLDRSLQAEYVGSDVEAFSAASTVTSVKLVSSQNQVRFCLASGSCLVFDYLVKQWSVWSNIAAKSAAFYQNKFAYIASGGTVNVETPGTFTDNGSFIQLSLTTGWLSFAKLQGFQRVWYANILGTYKSPHTLQVTIQKDFINTTVQTFSISVPSSPTFGYAYELHLSNQKCQSVRFTIQDSQSSSFGEGLSLSAISLEVGVEAAGNFPLPNAQSF